MRGMDTQKEFSRWRAFFWPIHRSERTKFLAMAGMFFLIVFNYNFLRTFKDTIVVTDPNSGAEAIPFIKVWAILPGALLLTYFFTRLTNRFSREKVFYIMMSIFLVFFALFTFILYPLRDFLHPHSLADYLQSVLPSGFKGLIAIFRNWTFTLFYVMCELWGTAIMSVLFWGFMNEVTGVAEARRYYGLLMTVANASSILAGEIGVWLARITYYPSVPYGTTRWEQSILFLNMTAILVGMLTIALFRFLNVKYIRPSEREKIHEEPEKVHMSLRQNFAYLSRSKYLLCIAAIVLTYNVAINLVEVVWKNQMWALYPDPSDYQEYNAKVTTWIGITATIASAFITGSVIRKFSWTFSAMIPAIITLLTGAGFFMFVLFQNTSLSWVASLAGFTPVAFGLFLGSMQNVLTRASKYTFYDATKEIAFIPLNKESKLKGKAAIDGVGSRLGKSGGSVIHQGLILFFSSIAATTPYVAVIFLIVLGIWIMSVFSLGRQFDTLTGVKRSPKEREPVLAKD
jgi:AAA family ATP:ADP antiporter